MNVKDFFITRDFIEILTKDQLKKTRGGGSVCYFEDRFCKEGYAGFWPGELASFPGCTNNPDVADIMAGDCGHFECNTSFAQNFCADHL